jgi:hypothetical protein
MARSPGHHPGGVSTSNLEPELGEAQRRLGGAADRLAGCLLGLDEDRVNCRRLAQRCDDLVAEAADDYGSLVGPAARVGELLRELDDALGRLSASTEELTACAGRLADRVSAFRSAL